MKNVKELSPEKALQVRPMIRNKLNALYPNAYDDAYSKAASPKIAAFDIAVYAVQDRLESWEIVKIAEFEYVNANMYKFPTVSFEDFKTMIWDNIWSLLYEYDDDGLKDLERYA